MFKLLMPALMAGLLSFNAFAEVVINGTRIVFNAKEKESAVQLKITGSILIFCSCGLTMATRNLAPAK